MNVSHKRLIPDCRRLFDDLTALCQLAMSGPSSQNGSDSFDVAKESDRRRPRVVPTDVRINRWTIGTQWPISRSAQGQHFVLCWDRLARRVSSEHRSQPAFNPTTSRKVDGYDVNYLPVPRGQFL
jgi:hypothetical protein